MRTSSISILGRMRGAMSLNFKQKNRWLPLRAFYGSLALRWIAIRKRVPQGPRTSQNLIQQQGFAVQRVEVSSEVDEALLNPLDQTRSFRLSVAKASKKSKTEVPGNPQARDRDGTPTKTIL